MAALRIDLHTHSTASDGTRSPAEVMARAAAAGLDVIALTDHDTTGGWAEAADALPDGLTLVPGAEISCAVGDPESDEAIGLHLLGYLFDPFDPILAQELLALRNDRRLRATAMIDRLRELGAPVEHADVAEIAGDGAVGRPHIAHALVRAGVVPHAAAAFTPDWIGDGGRAWVAKHALDPVAAVALVRLAGGVTVLAHPGASSRGAVVGEDVIVALAGAGLDGLEVDHPDHDAATRTRLRALAAATGLLVTGSSDDHGGFTGDRLGTETTSPEMYEALVARARVAPVVLR
jgi:predicted metal-dependent phosphoesterase TrpH